MTTLSATSILRSRNAEAPEKLLSTLLLRYPRVIHAEMLTHRAFSRNSASSRAIPVSKLIEDVEKDPFIPLHWSKNQKGMSAEAEISGDAKLASETAWLEAIDAALGTAAFLARQGLHKALCNRLLEPFAHITVLVSATEWDNFLELRDHEDAEPHIQMLAKVIRAELEREDNIATLNPGEWHIPFLSEEDQELSLSKKTALSVARCASTSYKTVEGFDMTLERAEKVYEKLITSKPMHASPAEHVAQADFQSYTQEKPSWFHLEQHGNFIGFRQLRHLL